MPFFLLGLAVFATAVLAASDDTAVTIDSGKISGLVVGDRSDVRVYRGVPYAAPPIGPNRWREPQPVIPWEGLRPCVEFSAACPQPKGAGARYGVAADQMSEDCLYLNVFAPVDVRAGKLPVMVWLHGGGFTVGTAASYDMERLARQGAVVVTVNYRLGIFGFFAHPELTAESPQSISGNYGILDMLAALRWVQRNAAAFGGDPDKVTIFGQSSGASAVTHLMASPQSGGLFQRAIAQSTGSYNPDPPLAQMEERGERFFSRLGLESSADGLSVAREEPWEVIQAASEEARADVGIRFGLNIDGWLLVEPTSAVFAKGRQHKIPLIIGSNADESDQEFTAGARYYAARHSELTPRVYRYFFSRRSQDPRFDSRGAVHGAEIPYMLGGTARLDAYWEAADRELAATMSATWVRFARTGDPRGSGEVAAWPRYRAESDPYLELGAQIRAASALRPEICDQADEAVAEELAAWYRETGGVSNSR